MGKTTLAHISAKHLGYNVAEINSSDDRSATAIRALIKKYLSCTDVRTGLKDAKTDQKIKAKPTCLIFDEIDGADSAAIDVICNLVNNLPKNDKHKNKTGGKKSNLPVLKTPIIAICNDLYTPSLRSLRNLALVLHVPQLETSNMVRRLKEILNADKILRNKDIPLAVLDYWVWVGKIFIFEKTKHGRRQKILKSGVKLELKFGVRIFVNFEVGCFQKIGLFPQFFIEAPTFLD